MGVFLLACEVDQPPARVPQSAAPADDLHNQFARQAERRDYEASAQNDRIAAMWASQDAERKAAEDRQHADEEAARREHLASCVAGESSRKAILAAADAKRAEVAKWCGHTVVQGISPRDEVTVHPDGAISVQRETAPQLVIPACAPGTPREIFMASMTRDPEVVRARAEQRDCERLQASFASEAAR